MRWLWKIALFFLILDFSVRWIAPKCLEYFCSSLSFPQGQLLRLECKSLSWGRADFVNIHLKSPQGELELRQLQVSFGLWDVVTQQRIRKIVVEGIKLSLLPEPDKTQQSEADSALAQVHSDAKFSFEKMWQEPLVMAGNALAEATRSVPFEVQEFSCRELLVQHQGQILTLNHGQGQLTARTGLMFEADLDYNQIPFQAQLKVGQENLDLGLTCASPKLVGEELQADLQLHWNLLDNKIHAELALACGAQRLLTTLSGNSVSLQGNCIVSNTTVKNKDLASWNWAAGAPLKGSIGEGLYRQNLTLLPCASGWRVEALAQHKYSEWYFEPDLVSGKFSANHLKFGAMAIKDLLSQFERKSHPENNLISQAPTWNTRIGELGNSDVVLSDIVISVPLDVNDKGQFKANIKAAGKNAVVDLSLQRWPLGWQASGNLQCTDLPLPLINLFLCAKLDQNFVPQLELSADIPRQDLSLRPEEFSPNAPNGSLQINFSANVRCAWSWKEGWQEHLIVRWSNGFFANDDFSILLKGFYGHIENDRLSSFATGPAQLLGWQSLKGHGFNIQEGHLYWQWEKEQRFFLESLRTKWCHGHITIQPIRLKMPIQELDLSLFCENLQLADLLSEFQVGDVEGQGELGGHINAILSPKGMTFKDAYLYTSPASEGRLKIAESQVLDMMVGRDDQSHLRLVREALRDYVYQWAKVQFDAEGQDLVLRLSLDGKPKNLLPFRFDDKLGVFAYEVDGAGAHLQGLKINTNLKSLNLWPVIQALFSWSQMVEY